MPWGRMDDSMAFHPKIVEAGNEATGARDRMISWCCKHGTDGWIPTEIVKAICGKWALVRRLVSFKMLDAFDAKTDQKMDTIDGKFPSKNSLRFKVHNHLRWNMSAKEWAEYSALQSVKGKKGAAARWGKGDGRGNGRTIADPDHDPDPFDPKIAGAISSTADMEKAIGQWGWGFTMTEKERGNCHRITGAGAIQPHEIEDARTKSQGKKRPVSYFLTCVEGARADFAEALAGDSPAPKPRAETAMEKAEREFIAGAANR